MVFNDKTMRYLYIKHSSIFYSKKGFHFVHNFSKYFLNDFILIKL